MSRQRPGQREAYELSVLSLVASSVAVVMGAVSAFQTRSATALGYSLENSVDFCGSVLVLWRFTSDKSDSKQRLESREQRADAGISIMFLILGSVVFVDALKDILHRDRDRDLVELIALYSPSLVVFLLLGVAKIHVGRCVRSQSLQKDGACSLAGALLSAGVLLSAVVEKFSTVWWLDSFVAVIVSTGLAAKGLSSLYHFYRRNRAFWTYDFWVSSDATSCGGGDDLLLQKATRLTDDEEAPLLLTKM